jgi:ComF family protein
MFSRFVDLFFPPRTSELLVRSIGREGLTPYIEPRICEIGPRNVVTLLPYDMPAVRACVLEAKFHGSESAAKMLGNVLASYLREECGDLDRYEQRAYVLVPVPLSKERVKERGYNQVEMIARHADTHIDTKLLIRLRDTLPQTTLDGTARRQNMRGAFGAARIPDPSLTYFVLDDVVTTGSTIGEAVRTLYDAGARNVQALALTSKIGKGPGNAVG